jgi:superfamily II DNA or RNA helicase
MKLVLNNKIIVSNISAEEKKLIKKYLTTPNTEYFSNLQFGRPVEGLDKYIVQYTEQEDNIVVPRGFLYGLITSLGIPESIEDQTTYFPPVSIPSKIQLKPLQIPWVDELMKHRQGTGVAPPGSGKTVMSLHVIATLGQPTLWLTHRQLLADQVEDRINKFVDIGKVGVIGDGRFELGDILTVGMIPTLYRRDLSSITKMFGTIIVDEVHHASALSQYAVIEQFSPRYLYGITATPFRSDKMECVTFNLIGPIVVRMNRQEAIKQNNIMQPTVVVRKTHWDNQYLHNTPNIGRIMKYLMKNRCRNEMIVNDVYSEASKGNICIILTVTVKHGQILSDMLSALGFKSAHIHSKLKGKEAQELRDRFLSKELNVLFATYSLVAEGFDHVAANRLFLAAPRKGEALIEQATGRVERTCENKVDAIIYDYVDEIPMFRKQFYARQVIYQRNGMQLIFK